MKKIILAILTCVAIVLNVSCTSTIKNLGKSEIDMVSDTFIQKNTQHIQNLITQLYASNPQELEKANPPVSIEERVVQIIRHPLDTTYAELNHTTALNTITLAFDKQYTGDRVFALLIGMHGMLRLSFNDQEEVFMLDELDPQRLYNSAQNMNIILTRMHTETQNGQALFRLGTIVPEESAHNTLIKIMANQEVLAQVIAQKTHRAINRVVHGAAGILLPI